MYIPKDILNLIFKYKKQLLFIKIHKELKKKFFNCNFCKEKKIKKQYSLCLNCLEKKICKKCFTKATICRICINCELIYVKPKKEKDFDLDFKI